MNEAMNKATECTEPKRNDGTIRLFSLVDDGWRAIGLTAKNRRMRWTDWAKAVREVAR